MIPRLAKSEPAAGLTIEDLHERMVAFGENCFSLKGAAPFIWAIWDGNYLLWVETPWEDEDEKYLSVAFIKRLMGVADAKMYSFMHEAWAKTVSAGEMRGNRQVKDMPGREDVLMIHTHSIDGGFLGTRFKVTIRESGPNFLGVRDDESLKGMKNAEGTMFNLFRQMGVETA